MTQCNAVHWRSRYHASNTEFRTGSCSISGRLLSAAAEAEPGSRDMTIPSEYQRATVEFERFMVDARDAAGLATTNMAWNMVVGVLRTFRRRLSTQDAIGFANVLPPVVRAIFVADWDFNESPLPFDQSESLIDEVRDVRRAHNFSPDSAIQAVAHAVRRHVDHEAFERALAKLPAGAAKFWAVTREGC